MRMTISSPIWMPSSRWTSTGIEILPARPILTTDGALLEHAEHSQGRHSSPPLLLHSLTILPELLDEPLRRRDGGPGGLRHTIEKELEPFLPVAAPSNQERTASFRT